jgi:hypothetical protein
MRTKHEIGLTHKLWHHAALFQGQIIQLEVAGCNVLHGGEPNPKLGRVAVTLPAHSVNIGHVRQLTQGVGSTLWYASREVYPSFLYGSRMIPLCI